MSKDKTYDPYESARRISEMLEKGLNGLLFQSLNRNDLVRMTKVGLESHSRYMEILRKNQDLMAFYMNLPTKNDVANVAKLTVQAEEKMDILEEQIWKLQDSFTVANKEQLNLFKELLNFTKQMKAEWLKTAQELAETKKISENLLEMQQEFAEAQSIKAELTELKQELVQLKELKKEFSEMKELLKKDKEEPALASSGAVK